MEREIRLTVWLDGENVGTLPRSECVWLIERGSRIVARGVDGSVIGGAK